MDGSIPAGWHTVTVRLFVSEPEELIRFLQGVFAATGEFATTMPSVLLIGDSRIMVSGTEVREAMPAFLHLYVEDADAAYRRAIEAGARTVEEPADMPYGDRRAMVEDRWGNCWQIATYRGTE